MLRFSYLLSLLVCIELSFSYNYRGDVTQRKINYLERNLRRQRARRARASYVRKSPIHREEAVEFDVASFIHPDKDNLETDEPYMSHRINNRGKWTPKHFYIGSVLKSDDSNNKMEKTPDCTSMGDSLPELNLNPPLSKDLINAKHFTYNPLDDLNGGKYGHEKFRNIYKDDLLMNQMVHVQEKKCSALKNMKFPFFSRNVSEPLKPKKEKKRRLLFFNSKKEAAKNYSNKMNDDPMISYKTKRSYEQRLCSDCKKIFLGNMDYNKPRKNPTNIIHDSRQFYQNTLL